MNIDVSFIENLIHQQVILAEEFLFYLAEVSGFWPSELGVYSYHEGEVLDRTSDNTAILYYIIENWGTERIETEDMEEEKLQYVVVTEIHNMETGVFLFEVEEEAIKQLFLLEGRRCLDYWDSSFFHYLY